MSYEAWRISYQSSEQAARAAWVEWHKVVNAKPAVNDFKEYLAAYSLGAVVTEQMLDEALEAMNNNTEVAIKLRICTKPAECAPFGYWFERERRFANCEEAERYFDESDRLELLVALYTTPQPCPEIYSKDVMNRIQTICEQSLTPEIYDKWVEVSEALYKTRRDLK